MKNYDPKFDEVLAGEYVLGTLRGRARERFERQVEKDPRLKDLVRSWEKKLSPMAEALPPVEPSSRVWRRIEARLDAPSAKAAPWWSRVSFWRPFALTAAAAAVGAFLYFGVISPRPPTVTMPAHMAVLADKKNASGWVLTVNPSAQEITAMVMHPEPMKPDQSYELWMLPGKDQAPISLGLLPMQGSSKMKVEKPMFEKLMGASGLAVSLEPAGGSPTGAPTGPVMYQGSLLALEKA